MIAGLKPLRDAVAAWLGVDDADSVVAWHYHQITGTPLAGVAVVIAHDWHATPSPTAAITVRPGWQYNGPRRGITTW